MRSRARTPLPSRRPRDAVSLAGLVAACLLLTAGTTAGRLRAEPATVVLNEIHYHPADDSRDGEFIELLNHGSAPVDMSGWALVGGVQLIFPSGLVLAPGEIVLVAANRAALAARLALPPEIIVGEWVGSLENAGEKLFLYTEDGYLASFIEWDDSGHWPERADGLGPSLERRSALREESDAQGWAASHVVGGTPGEENSVREDVGGGPTGETVSLIGAGQEWRFRRGNAPPPADWNARDFNDEAWERGNAGFGYGDGDDATVLEDMPGNYLTVFIRKSFSFDTIDRLESLILSVDYDDGFVAYLNGVEVARANVPDEGWDVPTGNSHEAGSPESFVISNARALLVPGFNVLALQGHNADLPSSDFSLSPALEARLTPEDVPPGPEPTFEAHPRDLVINELATGGVGTGWVEIYNPGSSVVDASGRHLSLFPFAAGDHTIAAGTTLAAGARRVLTEAQLGFELDGIATLLLTAADRRYIDALNPRTVPGTQSVGRWPDGAENRYVFPTPSRNAANIRVDDQRVVINEIQYHPSDTNTGGEWIELHNRSAAVVDLAGWAFTRGISYVFPAGTRLAAGGYLVVARNPTAVMDAYGITGVLGPFTGGLSNSAETILLRDALDNVADRVRYADEGSWPETPDGEGPTVELRNPNLENRWGVAWGASSVPGGTPGAVNSRFQAAPGVLVAGVSHSPVIPRADQSVRVLATASDVAPLASVTLFWNNDAGGAASSIAMLDDGVADDGIPANGVYGATIPPFADRTIVGFWITAIAADGSRWTEPSGAPDRAHLYQVESTLPERARPIYRIIMRQARLNEFRSRSRGSNVLLDLTFVADGKAYYNRGIRLRGSSARSCDPLSYRIQFDHDRDFEGIQQVYMNGCNSWRQWVGYDFLRRVGMPTPAAWFRHLSFNGAVETQLHLRVEAIKADFLERVFPDDADGNLYRGVSQANLDYRGENFDSYRGDYQKETNEAEDDYSDIVDLCFRFDRDTTSDADFPAAIEERVDVFQWTAFFAAWAVLGTTENSILLNNGDDYFLYHRFSDDRWVLLPWDTDSTFDEANQELFRPTVDQVERLLEHPRYAPDYLCFVQYFLDTAFQLDRVNARIDVIAPLFPAGQITTLRNFAVARRAYLEPRLLSGSLDVTGVSGGSSCGGVLYPSRETVTLRGTAPGCGTFRVQINGADVAWNPGQLQWSGEVSVLGLDHVDISTIDRNGVETGRLRLTVAEIEEDSGGDVFEQGAGDDFLAGKAAEAHEILDPDGDGNIWAVQAGVAAALIDDRVLKAPAQGPTRSLNQSEAVYRLLFTSAGTYRAYYRMRGFNQATNSIWTPSAFGRAPDVNVTTTQSGNFDWSEGPNLVVTQADVTNARELEFKVGVRENQTELDAFVLTRVGLNSAALDSRVSARGGSTRPPRIVVTVSPGAEVPMVNGVAQVLIDASASQDGSCGGAPLDFLWDKVSGPAGDAFAGADDEPQVLVLMRTEGDYVYRVTVTNRQTGVSTDRDVSLRALAPSGNAFRRCDTNGDGAGGVSDAIFLLLALFSGGDQPACRASADCNGDSAIGLTDAVYFLNHLFTGGPAPPAPYPSCDRAPVEACATSTCAG